MGHPNNFPKQNFYRVRVAKHWKTLCYVVQHCLSIRSASFDYFPSIIASPIVYMVANIRFELVKWIMNVFILNLEKGVRYKFLMYPSFL